MEDEDEEIPILARQSIPAVDIYNIDYRDVVGSLYQCDEDCRILKASTPKAIKEHKCDWCFDKIGKGSHYVKTTVVFDTDGVFTYKTCLNCVAVISDDELIEERCRRFDEVQADCC